MIFLPQERANHTIVLYIDRPIYRYAHRRVTVTDYYNFERLKLRTCIHVLGRERVNPRISTVWSTTKPIETFSYTPRVQEVHTKAEVLHLTPGLLDIGVLFSCHAYCET